MTYTKLSEENQISNSKSFMRKLMLSASAITAISMIQPAFAQEASNEDQSEADETESEGGLSVIVVTAQKRAQDSQDIGASISAFSEEEALLLGNDIGALAGQSPSVESYGNGTYLQSFFIRGIGLNEFSGNFNAPVALHNDEVYVSKNWQAARPNFDINRIEILKGPQGTIFGRNTTGGAVNFYNNEPTRDFEASLRFEADEFERYNVQGAISGPLTNTLSGRFSFYSGFGNGGPQFNLFDGEEHGAPDVHQFRGQLLWEGNDTRVKFLAYGGIDKSEVQAYKGPGIFNANGPGFCPEAIAGQVSLAPDTCAKFNGLAAADGRPELETEPADIFTINQDRPGEKDDSFYGGYLRIEHDFSTVTLTSLTSYDRYNRDQFEDSDSSPIASNNLDFFNELDQFTQELRLTGQLFNDRLNFVLGGFYQHDDLLQIDSLNLSETPFNLPPANAGLPPRLVGIFDQSVDSVAVFFNGEFEVTDRLTFIAGLRTTSETTEIDNGQTNAGLNDVMGDADIPATLLVPGGIDSLDDTTSVANPTNDGITDNRRTDTNVSWKLGVSYDLAEDVLAYANISTGFRTGGFSIPFGGSIVEFEDERVLATEAGLKTRFANNRIQLNTAFFYTRTRDAQVNVDDPLSPIVPITRNLPEIETFGFEADVKAQVTEEFSVNFGLSYLDSQVTDSGGALVTTIAENPLPLQGNTPVNTPDWQISGAANYARPISENVAFFISADARWVDDRFLEITNAPADAAGSYTVVNGRIGLTEIDGKWDLTLFAKNLFNERYLTYTNNLPGPGFKLDIFGEQRSFGLSVGYKF